MSSTLAGNLTLIGSVAKLIVAQQAERARERSGEVVTDLLLSLPQIFERET